MERPEPLKPSEASVRSATGAGLAEIGCPSDSHSLPAKSILFLRTAASKRGLQVDLLRHPALPECRGRQRAGDRGRRGSERPPASPVHKWMMMFKLQLNDQPPNLAAVLEMELWIMAPEGRGLWTRCVDGRCFSCGHCKDYEFSAHTLPSGTAVWAKPSSAWHVSSVDATAAAAADDDDDDEKTGTEMALMKKILIALWTLQRL